MSLNDYIRPAKMMKMRVRVKKWLNIIILSADLLSDFLCDGSKERYKRKLRIII